MSGFTEQLIINSLILTSVLEADLGPHRKVGPFRIARPILTSAAIVPLFFKGMATSGSGLALEIGLTVAGLLLGLLCVSQLTVYRSPRTGKPVSRAGGGYAAVWIVIIGARTAFSYGADHWFRSQLGTWMQTNQITVDALTDALVLMALGTMVVRTSILGGRAAGIARGARQPVVA